MSRPKSKKTSTKHSAVPPTAAASIKKAEAAKVTEAAKPAIAAAPATVVATEKTAAPAVAIPVIASQPAAAVATAVVAPVAAAVVVAVATPEVAIAAAPVSAASLITSLHDSDADVARDAALALGALGDKSAVEPLIEVLNNFDAYHHVVARAAAAQSLAQLGDLRAVDTLLSAITDASVEVSAEAILGLGKLGDKTVVNALVDVVRNRTGFFLSIARRASVTALAQLGGEEAASELASVASNEWEEPSIREAAGHKACTEASKDQTACCHSK